MKQFFKMAFATVVGIFIFMLISGLLFMMCIIGLVSSSSSSIKPDGRVGIRPGQHPGRTF